jgi:hypothetical protein
MDGFTSRPAAWAFVDLTVDLRIDWRGKPVISWPARANEQGHGQAVVLWIA